MSRKKQVKRSTEVVESAPKFAVSEAELIERFATELMNHPQFNEAFTQADLELALEDRDWIGGLGGMASEKWTCDLQPQQRRLLIERSRMYWHRDPLAHQAVRLWTDYCFGDDGFSIESEDPQLKDEIDAIFDDPKNRMYFSAQGQKRLSNRLLVDGDMFLAVFEDRTVRLFDALQMSLITDPDDEDVVLGYRRKTNGGQKLYYTDWAYADRNNELYDPDDKVMGGKSLKKVVAEDNVVMYRLSFDPLGKYGNGLLNTSTPWMSSHRRFMQARVNLLEALSKIAYKLTVKGGPNAIAAAKTKLQSSMVDGGTTNGVERNPPSVSASTYIGNDGAKLDAMPRSTSAGDAKGDSDSLKLMVCAGTGIFQHYFGDPSTGNLAIGTAMELPMMKQFGAYQKLWKDAAADILSIMLDKKPADLRETISLPPLIQDDLQKLGTFLGTLTSVFPEAKTDAVLRECLISMGVPDVDVVLEEAKANRVKIDAQNEFNNQVQMAKAKMPIQPAVKKDGVDGDQPAGGTGADYTEAQVTKLVTAIEKLSESL